MKHKTDEKHFIFCEIHDFTCSFTILGFVRKHISKFKYKLINPMLCAGMIVRTLCTPIFA